MSLYDPALRYFLAVFETGSVNAAARRLYVSSSAVSRQVARLEREVGSRLFERLPDGVVATDAGHAFAGYARLAIENAAQVTDEIHQRQHVRPVITIASTTGIASDLIPTVAARFRVDHPRARFVIRVAEPSAVTEMVRDGSADLAVTFALSLAAGVTIAYSREAPLRAVMRKGHPLADRRQVSIKQLVDYPLALPPAPTTNRILVEACAASYRVPLEPVLECHGPEAATRLVLDSDAVTVQGRVSVRRRVTDGDLVLVPLKEKELNQRTIQVQTRSAEPRSPALAAYTELLIAELERAA